MQKLEKMYAAYRSGCLGEDRLSAYFPYFASLIYEKRWTEVNEELVRKEFEKKYGIPVPATFTRQVLGKGIENGSIVYKQGCYIVDRIILKDHSIDTHEFDCRWQRLVMGFKFFCKKHGIDFNGIDFEEAVLEIIDECDENVVSGEKLKFNGQSNKLSFAWGKYIDEVDASDHQLMKFYVAISLANIMRQTIFLCEDIKTDFSQLTIYLDSPIIFALLEMDYPDRVDSCKMLMHEAITVGCKICILDNNLQEVKGIILRASGKARSVEYDISKANKVAAYLHDSEMSVSDMSILVENIEQDLFDKYSITIKKTAYDVYANKFQEDEDKLFKLIESEYASRNQKLEAGTIQSIKIDVRSIIMIYRERKGKTSTTIKDADHIMLTMNNAIAIACKKYESESSIQSGHIPACITSDLFGAVMWLSKPATLMEYRKQKLLADCYSAMQPTQKMLDRFSECLRLARDASEINEEKFMFLRSSPYVREAIMDVTKGDYNSFNQNTPEDVYNAIVANAESKYANEASEHKKTQKKLEDIQKDDEKLKIRTSELEVQVERMNETIEHMEKSKIARRKREIDKKSNRWSHIVTALIFGLPLAIGVAVLDIFKAKLTELNIKTILLAALIFVVVTLALFLYGKIRNAIFRLFQKHFEKQDDDE